MQLSKNVSLAEFCHSETAVARGIDNTIKDPVHLDNAKTWAENVFQPIREYLNRPIKINSGYRSKALNKAIPGSSSTSQHCFGEAGDLNLTDRDLFEWILDNVIFDQIIFEGGTEDRAEWFHISYREGRNRKQALRMIKKNGKSTYVPYVRKK
jgi:hypothetical protein